MNKKELKQWLLDNCVKNGVLDLSGLDFSDFNGIVDISHLKVKYSLNQDYQTVGGDLSQSNQKVDGNLFQMNCKVEKDIIQNNQSSDKDIIQNSQKAKREIISCNSKV